MFKQSPSEMCPLPRRRRLLPLTATACLLVFGAWIWLSADMRASVAIHADSDFSAPELWIDGKRIITEVQSRGPWRFYAWANLRLSRAQPEIVVAWIGADGRRRVLRDMGTPSLSMCLCQHRGLVSSRDVPSP